MYHTKITKRQVQALFTAMAPNRPLKKLNLFGINLSSVDADVLALAVNRLEEVDFRRTGLDAEQLNRILIVVTGMGTRLLHNINTVGLLTRRINGILHVWYSLPA